MYFTVLLPEVGGDLERKKNSKKKPSQKCLIFDIWGVFFKISDIIIKKRCPKSAEGRIFSRTAPHLPLEITSKTLFL